jgi:APA family basic amino acid/polyamine antiporter
MGITSVISYEEAVPLAGSLNISVLAVSRLFGPFFGSLISYFVLISVLGTLNGLTLASMRGFYQIGVKKVGFKPDLMVKLTKHEAPLTSGIFSIVMSLFWGLIWLLNINGTFNTFIDTSILPIIFLYSFYIIIYVYIMRHYKDLNFFKRYIVTGLSIVGSLYLIYGAYTSSPLGFIYYVLILIGFAGIALYTYKPKALK